jgi:hypothetical protein
MKQEKNMFTETITHVLSDVNIWKNIRCLWDLMFILSFTIVPLQARLDRLLTCQFKGDEWVRTISGVKMLICNNEAGFIKFLKFIFFILLSFAAFCFLLTIS